MKFDFVIGNPPYQEEVENNERQSAVYYKFMDEAYKVADCVELITPARFLFDVGQTPKAWNKKMLNDEHFKVLLYEPNCTKIFPNTEIKGGVAITIRNSNVVCGKIGVFTKYDELKGIIQKVRDQHKNNQFFDSIISPQGIYRFSDLLLKQYPKVMDVTGAGTGNKITSRLFELLPEIFLKSKPDVDPAVKILGRVDNLRAYRYILRKYLQDNIYIDKYNVAFPQATGSGVFGEVLSPTQIISPNEGTADTFLNIGLFETKYEAESVSKYIKTKFLRTLLSVFKTTQNTPNNVWQLIPILDFTPQSDIDWSCSIHEIDRQLYKKYGLTDEEREFIETHVKEMP